MALYIPHSIFHLERLSCTRPETFGPYYVLAETCSSLFLINKLVFGLRNLYYMSGYIVNTTGKDHLKIIASMLPLIFYHSDFGNSNR
jgi:hypothetical protein